MTQTVEPLHRHDATCSTKCRGLDQVLSTAESRCGAAGSSAIDSVAGRYVAPVRGIVAVRVHLKRATMEHRAAREFSCLGDHIIGAMGYLMLVQGARLALSTASSSGATTSTPIAEAASSWP